MTGLLIMAAALWTPLNNQKFTNWGVGRTLCSEAWVPGAAARSQDWVHGFWTGLNLGTRQDIAEGTSSAPFVARVRLHCVQEPSDQLFNASVKAFLELERAGAK